MKQFICAFILLAFIGLSGCSEKTQSPVSPNDQTTILKDNPSLSKITITRFTAKDYSVQLLDPGQVTIVGSTQITRGLVMQDRYEASTPLLTGNVINTLNLVMDLTTGRSEVSGTFVITPDIDVGGGKWEINYTGLGIITGQNGKSRLVGEGRGVGGTIDGMIYLATLVIHSTITPTSISWEGNATGIIKSNNSAPL